MPAEVTQIGRLCLIVHSEGVPPDLCCHTNYQSASARTLHWHSGWHRGIAPLSQPSPAPPQRTQSMCQNESRHTVRRVSNGVGNRLALGPRSRYQKLNHDLDPSAWYKATDGFGPSRTDAQADQALCFPVLCGDTCMRVWSSKHRGLSARRAALPWNLAFWLSITTATRPARY